MPSTIASHGSKYILYSDLERVLKTHNHFDNLERDDISLLISRFDRDGDGRIEFNEFYE
jgi:Ca2+-binding EF-hand superfamily protein